MYKQNYNKEIFLDVNNRLLLELETIANALCDNLADKKKHWIVSDLVKYKSFNKAWIDVKPNNFENEYSKKEFKGIYVFSLNSNKSEIRYIGISKTIRRRFYSHANRLSSWVHLMARDKYKNFKSFGEKRKREIFRKIQLENVYPCKFTFVKIDNNMLLHLAEVFCVNKLHSYYNSFETH